MSCSRETCWHTACNDVTFAGAGACKDSALWHEMVGDGWADAQFRRLRRCSSREIFGRVLVLTWVGRGRQFEVRVGNLHLGHLCDVYPAVFTRRDRLDTVNSKRNGKNATNLRRE